MLARDRTMSFQVIADEGPTPAKTSRPDVRRGDGSAEDVCVA
jgi:hypothetical protein